jgi:hypothetical protein
MNCSRHFGLLALCLVSAALEPVRAQEATPRSYSHAVEYCRGNVQRPMALDPAKQILCFDGKMLPGDNSSVQQLEPGGLFVVRGHGTDAGAAISLANAVHDRRATVVIYDYCLDACASYLFVASAKTIVLKDALVAWRHLGVSSDRCAGFTKDNVAPRLDVGLCPEPLDARTEANERERSNELFYRERLVDPHFKFPPQSFVVRKTLKSLFDGTGAYPDVMWMWNPRHYASTLKTKIEYEAYPKSQAEVDAIAQRLGLVYRVIYDP